MHYDFYLIRIWTLHRRFSFSTIKYIFGQHYKIFHDSIRKLCWVNYNVQFDKGRWWAIANYLITHYKGVYRLKTPYDLSTNQFPRKLDGTYEDMNIYISCQHDMKIFYYGRNTLQAYIPSLIRGHNIIKAINENFGQDKIFNIEDSLEISACYTGGQFYCP